jgi:hypothetical protein
MSNPVRPRAPGMRVGRASRTGRAWKTLAARVRPAVNGRRADRAEG